MRYLMLALLLGACQGTPRTGETEEVRAVKAAIQACAVRVQAAERVSAEEAAGRCAARLEDEAAARARAAVVDATTEDTLNCDYSDEVK